MCKIIIQARMGSTRLPGKVLKKVCGKPLLQYMLDRLSYLKHQGEIIVATTTKEIDDEIVNLCNELKVSFFRGSEDDVLDRYYKCAKKYDASVIVRLTADCPLIDSQIVDEVIDYYLNNDFDFVSNVNPRSFPDGLDVEVFSLDVLEKAWKQSKHKDDREHVTPFIVNNFTVGNVKNNINLSKERWTVDYQEDFDFVKDILEHMYTKNKMFFMSDILDYLGGEKNEKKVYCIWKT